MATSFCTPTKIGLAVQSAYIVAFVVNVVSVVTSVPFSSTHLLNIFALSDNVGSSCSLPFISV